MRGDKVEVLKIIKNIKKGKIKYFEQLIDVYEGKVYGFIFSIVKDEYHTQDLVQETFIKIFKNFDKFDESKNFSTWLLTIARNLSYDHLRKYSRLTVVKNLEIETTESPESIALDLEFNMSIDKYVQRLPEHLSQLIYMKYFDELTYEEIGQSLMIETKRVKWQLYEARKKLQKMMTDEEVFLWTAK